MTIKDFMTRKTFYRILWVLAIPALVLSVIYHDRPELFFLGTMELLAIAVVVNTFVILYWRRNWNANAYGRGLMYSKISLAVLADLSLVTLMLGPDWPYRSSLRFFLFGGILVAQTRMLQLLFALRNQTALDKYDEEHQNEKLG